MADEPEPQLRTFLIADVRGWTTFTASRGDEAAAALAARFAAVTRAVVTDHSGRLVELRGDEALVVCSSARSAIRAALALQDRFVTETLADPMLPLPVGIGLDAGEAVEVEGGFRGGVLNLAARLCSAAVAGQVLASREVTHLARHVDGVRYLERGNQQFKGLANPTPVVEVLPLDVDADREAAFLAVIAAPRTRRRPVRKLLIAVALVLALGVLAGTYAIVRATRGTAVLSAENRVDVIDLGSGDVVDQVLLDRQPSGVAAGAGALWVTNEAAGTVSRLDMDSHRVQATIPVDGQPTGVVVAEGSVWVSLQDARAVARINPDVDQVVDSVTVGNTPTGIAAGPSGVWVANNADGTVTRIDPRTGKASDTVDVGSGPAGIAVTDDTVWVTNSAEGSVSAIDSSTASPRASYPVGNGPTGIAEAAGSLWVANNLDGTLARLAPDTGAVTAVSVGNGPTSVTAADGSVWVSNEYGADLVRVDPTTNQVDLTLPVGGTPHGLAAADGNLWVTAGASGTSHRGGTLRVLWTGELTALSTIDPVIAFNHPAIRIPYDGLVGIRRSSGAAGTTLVPNLATSIPNPVENGTTYAFQLRSGIRYSNGATVQASDFRRGVERALADDYAGSFFSGIRGATGCLETPATCDLSSGIETDDASGSVTFHLLKPDAEFLYKLSLPLAIPVPSGTPARKIGTRPIPATGPYMIARFVPNRLLEMVRNPYFQEWSRAAKPDGYPDQIAYRAVADPDSALDQVLQGSADLTYGPFPDRMKELNTRYPAQLHLDLSPYLKFITLTTDAPPFNDVRARRALNYAVDRAELVRRLGGSDKFVGSCQVLPPSFLGYAPYCRYQKDVHKARHLVKSSETTDERVTISVPLSQLSVGKYLERALNGLGYHARLEKPPPTDLEQMIGVYSPQQRAQLLSHSWGFDYPVASGYLQPLFSCSGSKGAPRPFCEPGVDVKIQRALALQQSQPAAVGRLWQQADRAVVDRAGLLPLGFPLDAVVTSRRAGNYLSQPFYGVMVDQLWVNSGTE